MSRRTDTERGALIALAICDQQLQPQLFPAVPPASFWLDIHHAAVATLNECDHMRKALAA